MIRFCIVATSRSGTSYLATALTGFPKVLCHGEVFHRNVAEHISAEYTGALDFSLREQNPIAFVDQIFALKTDLYAAGFKIFRGHSDTALAHILADREIKKIVLRRENVLASYSSLLIAIKTGHWQSRPNWVSNWVEPPSEARHDPEAQPMEPVESKVTFDPARFRAYWDWECQTYDYYRGSIADAKGDYLDIDYLTLTTGDFSSVERFLDLPVGHVWKTDVEKLNTRTILDQFYNPNDVLEFAREWKIEHWLRE